MSDRFYLYRDQGKFIRIDLHDILYLQSTGNYTQFEGKNQSHIVRISLERSLELLPEKLFIRPTRSNALCLHNLKAFNKESAWFKEGEPELEYTPSKKYFDECLKKINFLGEAGSQEDSDIK